ncbi:MAG: ferredoxin reductase family protein [Solirubrobacteraceae bacterium]
MSGGAVALPRRNVPAGQRARSRVALYSAAIAAIVLGNGAAIVWMWLHGGGISRVHGRAEGFTSLGRITGLLGVYLALLQVLMLARLPLLERLIGFDRLTVWHKLNGKVCIGLIVAHALLITAGYSLAERITFGKEFSRLLDSYPQLVTATIGTGVMIAVVLSSIAIARRRLRYESWYLIHISVYAGIALGYLHQLPTGNEFVVHPVQADYWIALYAATLAILLAYRVALPIRNALRYELRVASVHPEARGVTSIEVRGRGIERLNVQPGQFMLWRFMTRGRWWQSHPFSVSALAERDRLRLTVKDVGDFSSAIGELKPGTRVFAEGPFGVFTAAARRLPSVALIAGGIGITPLRALFDELAGSADVTLIYRAISQRDVVFERELSEIGRRPGARFELVLGDHRGRSGVDALSAKRLARLLPDLPQRDVYVCGPPAMIDATTEALAALGVQEDQIHTERFALAA